MKRYTVRNLCHAFGTTSGPDFNRGRDELNAAKAALIREGGADVLDFLFKIDFLVDHPIGDAPLSDVVDIAAQALNRAIRLSLSFGVYPIDIARDGTLILVEEGPLIQTLSDFVFDNWGASRVGVCVTCASTDPLMFVVRVGPFFELERDLKEALAAR